MNIHFIGFKLNFAYPWAIIFGSLLVACSSTAYKGKLAPVPEWVFMDLANWEQSKQQTALQQSVHGRGQSKDQLLIAKRRSLAEAAAIKNVKTRFVNEYESYVKQNPEVQNDVGVIQTLPWEQIIVTKERYFDVEKNTQHALVEVTAERIFSVILFEKNMDPSKAKHWDQTYYNIERFFRNREMKPKP